MKLADSASDGKTVDQPQPNTVKEVKFDSFVHVCACVASPCVATCIATVYNMYICVWEREREGRGREGGREAVHKV